MRSITLLVTLALALSGTSGCGGATPDADPQDVPVALDADVASAGDAPDGPSPDAVASGDAEADALAVDAEVSVAPELTGVSLIDNWAWTLVAVAEDPFVVDGGPAPDLCPESELQAEDTPDGIWFDISTEGCAWATIRQPLLRAVAPGDQVRVTVVHFEIEAGDTDYTLRVALGDEAEAIWTETVELGEGYELIEATVTVDGDHPEGAPIYYHVGNHGENNWSLVAIDLLVP